MHTLTHLESVVNFIWYEVFVYQLQNNLTHSFQSGYDPLHSTETALLRVTNDLPADAISILILLDLITAFDRVYHDILLSCLSSLSIYWQLHVCFASSLSERFHFVTSDKQKSTTASIIHGIPQGSVHGPFLFFSYVSPWLDHLQTWTWLPLLCSWHSDLSQYKVYHNSSSHLFNGMRS